MRSLKILIIILVCLSSCKPKDTCPEYGIKVVPDKKHYFPWDPVKLRVFYSERATYTWNYDNKSIETKESEITIPNATMASNLSCFAKIGKCVQSLDVDISVNTNPVPSCPLDENSITIDNIKLNISGVTYDKKYAAFYGRLTGVGASVNDSIKVFLSDQFEAKDSVGVFTVKTPVTSGYAYMEVRYGNLVFNTDQYYVIVYRRTKSGGSVECCGLSLMNSNLPSVLGSVKFKYEANF